MTDVVGVVHSRTDPNHLVLIPYVADLFAAAGTPGMLAAPAQLALLSPLGVGSAAKSVLG